MMERLAGDLVGRSALALAALVRSGQASARHVVQATWTASTGSTGRSTPSPRVLAGPEARAFLRDALAFSPPLDRDELIAEFARRTAIARRWAEFLADHQLLLGPIATAPLPL